MNEHVEKIKTHLKKHKTIYITGGAVVGTAVITYAIMRKSYLQHIDRGISVVADRGISVIADRSVVTNTISFVSSRRQGAPSWVVKCIETGDVYSSQLKAATEMGLPSSEISKQLNGLVKHVRGFHFERICLIG